MRIWLRSLKLITFLLSIYTGNIAAEDDVIDCTNEDIVTSVFNKAIDLTFAGTIRMYENVLINEILNTTNNEFDKKYIDARLEKNTVGDGLAKNLVIYTTELFSQYAKEQKAARITLKISLGCDMGRERTLVIFQPIKEGNYFSPIFTKQIYEIIMPTPIFAGFDLTLFEEISAYDDDLTNNEITFTSKNAEEHFIIVGTKNITDNDVKIRFYADVILNRIYLALSNELKFNITATDNGVPPKNTSALVIVRADPFNSLPPTPQFGSTLYSGTLTLDLFLEPLQIRLIAETYNGDVSFKLTGTDKELFTFFNSGNIIDVLLVKRLKRNDLKGKKYLQFEIISENKYLAEYGNAAFVVQVPNFKEYFHFTKAVYDGLITDAGLLQIDDILFDDTIYNNNEVIFQINGTYTEYFILDIVDNVIKLRLSRSFSLELLKKETFIRLEIVAHNDDLNATTVVHIKLPQQNNTTIIVADKQPAFEQSLYVGTIDFENFALQLKQINLIWDTYEIDKTEFSLLGNGSEHFDVVANENSVRLLLKRELMPEQFQKDDIFYLIVNAKNVNLQANATIVIENFQNTLQKIFNNTWYAGNITMNDDAAADASALQFLNMSAIQLKDEHRVNSFVYTLTGVESIYFAVAVDAAANRIYLKLIEALIPAILEQKSEIILQINAINIRDQRQNDTAVIFIELPRRDCPTPAPPSNLPVFDSNEYIFAAKPNQIGALGQISAIVQGANGNVVYSLNIDDEHLQKRLAINRNSGELILLSYVTPGIYYFTINAVNTVTFSNASVRAQLNVDNMLQCDDQNITVANVLIIKSIEEEKVHTNIMNMTVGECHFQIMQIYPNDKEYVYVNDLTKMLSTIAIDREDEIFVNMSEPQIEVKLKLLCLNVTDLEDAATRKQRDTTAHNYTHILANDIPFTRDITILKLIIVDINDNRPQFVESNKPSYIAYPSSEICFELFPQFLTQVHAVDRDAGFNARVRYSMRSNRHFGIDAITGIIYPKANALEHEAGTEIIVMATDRDGAKDGQSTATVVLVKRLSAAYFSLLTFKGNEWETTVELLGHLKNKTGYEIGIIKHATIPGIIKKISGKNLIKTRKFVRAADESAIIQKVWAYAFHHGEPILCKEFNKKLSTLPNEEQLIAAESYEETGLTSAGSNSTRPNVEESTVAADDMIYIITIVILALLCIGCTGVLIWQLYMNNAWCYSSKAAPTATTNCVSNVTKPTNCGVGDLFYTAYDDKNAAVNQNRNNCNMNTAQNHTNSINNN